MNGPDTAKQPIDADDESTWPDALLRHLEANRKAIAAFHRERARIDRAAEDDVTLRIDRPVNVHQAAWDEALALAERTVAPRHLLGLHATRLMEHEVEEIGRRVLQPLSVELLKRRLAAAQKAGALTAEQVARLLGNHQAADDNRSGRGVLLHTRAAKGSKQLCALVSILGRRGTI